MADAPHSRKVPNWLAAIILVVACVAIVLLAGSQRINLWRVERWIADNHQAWSQFVAEHPQAKQVRLFADTRSNGTLGVLMEGVDEATALKVEEFVSEHNPPCPVHYVSPNPR